MSRKRKKPVRLTEEERERLKGLIARGNGAPARQLTHTPAFCSRPTRELPRMLSAKPGPTRGSPTLCRDQPLDCPPGAQALVKEITGNDTISARFMRAEWFDFKPTHKTWLATNHKPEIRGTDPAIWDRIRLVPFSVRIPDEEEDRELPEKLRAELPGILA